MGIKLKPRAIFELSIIVLLFLMLYTERDVGYYGICTVLVLKPLLQITLIIILIFRIRDIFPIHKVTSLKILSPVLIGCFLIGSVLFANEIIYSREIIRFYMQRGWFNYVASTATQPTCDKVLEYGCTQWFDTPQSSATVYPFEGGLAIDVESRAYIGFMHLIKQTGLPQGKSIGIWKFSCEYELGDGWYLCGGGT